MQKEESMRMQKKQFRIGELAKQLGVERFVIRFWEKEFDLKASRSTGKQRFYTEDNLIQFEKIKELLYDKGFTIVGAKKQLCKKNETMLASKKTVMESTKAALNEELPPRILHLQKQLIKLRELL